MNRYGHPFWSLPNELQTKIICYLEIVNCVNLSEVAQFEHLFANRLAKPITIEVTKKHDSPGLQMPLMSLSEYYESLKSESIPYPSKEFGVLSNYLKSHTLPYKLSIEIASDNQLPFEVRFFAYTQDIDVSNYMAILETITEWQHNVNDVTLNVNRRRMFSLPFSNIDLIKLSLISNQKQLDMYNSSAKETYKTFDQLLRLASIGGFSKNQLLFSLYYHTPTTSQFPDIDQLKLAYSLIFGKNSNVFSEIDTLSVIRADNLDINMTFLHHFENIKNLRLTAPTETIYSKTVEIIKTLRKLQTLTLDNIKIYSLAIYSSSLKNLRVNGLGTSSVDLRNTPRLEKLYLEYLYEECFIQEMPAGIVELTLAGSRIFMSSSDIFPKAKKISITNSFLTSLKKDFNEMFPNVSDLKFSDTGSSNVENLNLQTIIGPNLDRFSIFGSQDGAGTLDFSNCPNLTDLNICGIVLNLSKIKLPPRLTFLKIQFSEIKSDEMCTEVIIPKSVQHLVMSNIETKLLIRTEEGSLLRSFSFKGVPVDSLSDVLKNSHYVELQ